MPPVTRKNACLAVASVAGLSLFIFGIQHYRNSVQKSEKKRNILSDHVIVPCAREPVKAGNCDDGEAEIKPSENIRLPAVLNVLLNSDSISSVPKLLRVPTRDVLLFAIAEAHQKNNRPNRDTSQHEITLLRVAQDYIRGVDLGNDQQAERILIEALFMAYPCQRNITSVGPITDVRGGSANSFAMLTRALQSPALDDNQHIVNVPTGIIFDLNAFEQALRAQRALSMLAISLAPRTLVAPVAASAPSSFSHAIEKVAPNTIKRYRSSTRTVPSNLTKGNTSALQKILVKLKAVKDPKRQGDSPPRHANRSAALDKSGSDSEHEPLSSSSSQGSHKDYLNANTTRTPWRDSTGHAVWTSDSLFQMSCDAPTEINFHNSTASRGWSSTTVPFFSILPSPDCRSPQQTLESPIPIAALAHSSEHCPPTYFDFYSEDEVAITADVSDATASQSQSFCSSSGDDRPYLGSRAGFFEKAVHSWQSFSRVRALARWADSLIVCRRDSTEVTLAHGARFRVVSDNEASYASVRTSSTASPASPARRRRSAAFHNQRPPPQPPIRTRLSTWFSRAMPFFTSRQNIGGDDAESVDLNSDVNISYASRHYYNTIGQPMDGYGSGGKESRRRSRRPIHSVAMASSNLLGAYSASSFMGLREATRDPNAVIDLPLCHLKLRCSDINVGWEMEPPIASYAADGSFPRWSREDQQRRATRVADIQKTSRVIKPILLNAEMLAPNSEKDSFVNGSLPPAEGTTDDQPLEDTYVSPMFSRGPSHNSRLSHPRDGSLHEANSSGSAVLSGGSPKGMLSSTSNADDNDDNLNNDFNSTTTSATESYTSVTDSDGDDEQGIGDYKTPFTRNAAQGSEGTFTPFATPNKPKVRSAAAISITTPEADSGWLHSPNASFYRAVSDDNKRAVLYEQLAYRKLVLEEALIRDGAYCSPVLLGERNGHQLLAASNSADAAVDSGAQHHFTASKPFAAVQFRCVSEPTAPLINIITEDMLCNPLTAQEYVNQSNVETTFEIPQLEHLERYLRAATHLIYEPHPACLVATTNLMFTTEGSPVSESVALVDPNMLGLVSYERHKYEAQQKHLTEQKERQLAAAKQAAALMRSASSRDEKGRRVSSTGRRHHRKRTLSHIKSDSYPANTSKLGVAEGMELRPAYSSAEGSATPMYLQATPTDAPLSSPMSLRQGDTNGSQRFASYSSATEGIYVPPVGLRRASLSDGPIGTCEASPHSALTNSSPAQESFIPRSSSPPSLNANVISGDLVASDCSDRAGYLKQEVASVLKTYLQYSDDEKRTTHRLRELREMTGGEGADYIEQVRAVPPRRLVSSTCLNVKYVATVTEGSKATGPAGATCVISFIIVKGRVAYVVQLQCQHDQRVLDKLLPTYIQVVQQIVEQVAEVSEGSLIQFPHQYCARPRIANITMPPPDVADGSHSDKQLEMQAHHLPAMKEFPTAVSKSEAISPFNCDGNYLQFSSICGRDSEAQFSVPLFWNRSVQFFSAEKMRSATSTAISADSELSRRIGLLRVEPNGLPMPSLDDELSSGGSQTAAWCGQAPLSCQYPSLSKAFKALEYLSNAPLMPTNPLQATEASGDSRQVSEEIARANHAGGEGQRTHSRQRRQRRRQENRHATSGNKTDDRGLGASVTPPPAPEASITYSYLEGQSSIFGPSSMNANNISHAHSGLLSGEEIAYGEGDGDEVFEGTVPCDVSGSPMSNRPLSADARDREGFAQVPLVYTSNPETSEDDRNTSAAQVEPRKHRHHHRRPNLKPTHKEQSDRARVSEPEGVQQCNDTSTTDGRSKGFNGWRIKSALCAFNHPVHPLSTLLMTCADEMLAGQCGSAPTVVDAYRYLPTMLSNLAAERAKRRLQLHSTDAALLASSESAWEERLAGRIADELGNSGPALTALTPVQAARMIITSHEPPSRNNGKTRPMCLIVFSSQPSTTNRAMAIVMGKGDGMPFYSDVKGPPNSVPSDLAVWRYAHSIAVSLAAASNLDLALQGASPPSEGSSRSTSRHHRDVISLYHQQTDISFRLSAPVGSISQVSLNPTRPERIALYSYYFGSFLFGVCTDFCDGSLASTLNVGIHSFAEAGIDLATDGDIRCFATAIAISQFISKLWPQFPSNCAHYRVIAKGEMQPIPIDCLQQPTSSASAVSPALPPLNAKLITSSAQPALGATLPGNRPRVSSYSPRLVESLQPLAMTSSAAISSSNSLALSTPHYIEGRLPPYTPSHSAAAVVSPFTSHTDGSSPAAMTPTALAAAPKRSPPPPLALPVHGGGSQRRLASGSAKFQSLYGNSVSTTNATSSPGVSMNVSAATTRTARANSAIGSSLVGPSSKAPTTCNSAPGGATSEKVQRTGVPTNTSRAQSKDKRTVAPFGRFGTNKGLVVASSAIMATNVLQWAAATSAGHQHHHQNTNLPPNDGGHRGGRASPSIRHEASSTSFSSAGQSPSIPASSGLSFTSMGNPSLLSANSPVAVMPSYCDPDRHIDWYLCSSGAPSAMTTTGEPRTELILIAVDWRKQLLVNVSWIRPTLSQSGGNAEGHWGFGEVCDRLSL